MLRPTLSKVQVLSSNVKHSCLCPKATNFLLPSMPLRRFVNKIAAGLYATPTSSNLDKLFSQVDENKKAITQMEKSIDQDTLQQFLRFHLNYHSNAIEGNSLSFSDVITFLRTGITVAAKPFKDYKDIEAYDAAMQWMFALSNQSHLEPSLIKQLHKLIMPPAVKKDDLIPGEYKQTKNATYTIDPDTHQPILKWFVLPEDVQHAITELMSWVRDTEAHVHAIHLASVAHYNLVRIHPFCDGNGRTARLFMNLLMLRRGYNPIIIDVTQRQEYMNALGRADKGDILPFTEYLASSLLATQQTLLELNSFT